MADWSQLVGSQQAWGPVLTSVCLLVMKGEGGGVVGCDQVFSYVPMMILSGFLIIQDSLVEIAENVELVS